MQNGWNSLSRNISHFVEMEYEKEPWNWQWGRGWERTQSGSTVRGLIMHRCFVQSRVIQKRKYKIRILSAKSYNLFSSTFPTTKGTGYFAFWLLVGVTYCLLVVHFFLYFFVLPLKWAKCSEDGASEFPMKARGKHGLVTSMKWECSQIKR